MTTSLAWDYLAAASQVESTDPEMAHLHLSKARSALEKAKMDIYQTELLIAAREREYARIAKMTEGDPDK